MRLDEKLKTIYETIAPTITRTEESWKDYLRFGSTVYKHPFDNTLLVYGQNPKATMLATFDTWKNPKVSRSINKGTKGIAVCEYANAKQTIKHLYDISQTNGAKIPDVWKLDDELRHGLVYRLSYSHDLTADNLTNCIEQIVGNCIADNLDDYLQGFENDIKDHFLGDMPRDGLVVELADIIYYSSVYYIANRCGETADVTMPTISHFDTIPLVARLGHTVTELSKGILAEIERNVKILENERSAKNEQRNYGKQGTPSVVEQSARGRNDGVRESTPRQVRQNGDEPLARNQPTKVFTFEDAGRAYDPDVQSGRGSDGAVGEDNSKTAEKRPDTENRRHYGTDAPLEQAEGYSGGNRNQRDGADTEVSESETEIEPQGSFSLPETQQTAEPIDDESIIKSDLLRGSMIQDSKIRIYNYVMTTPNTNELAQFLKDEYGWSGHSGFGNGVNYVNYSSKGIQFRLRDDSVEKGEREILLNWNNVAKRITELVNSGEYLPDQTTKIVTADIEKIEKNLSDNQIRWGYEHILTSTNMYPAEMYIAIRNRMAMDDDFIAKGEDVAEIYKAFGGGAELRENIIYRTELHGDSKTGGMSFYIGDNGHTFLPWFTVANIIDALMEERDYPDPARITTLEEETKIDDFAIPDEPESFGKSGGASEQLTIFDTDTQTVSPPLPEKRTSNDAPNRNYRAFNGLFPKIIDGIYSYLRLESDGYEPLSIERLGGNQYSIMHTFIQNGDLMRDPDMVIEINHDEQTIQALSYELSGMGVYQDVYTSDTLNKQLQRDLNNFLSTWLGNIAGQGFMPVRAILRGNDEDVEITFDEQGNPLNQPTQDLPDGKESVGEIPVRLTNETLNAHHGQLDSQIQAFIGENQIGVLYYSVYENIPRIENVEVLEDYRRQGIGTAMVRHLAGLYPDVSIEWSILTDDGKAFHDALTYEVENKEYTEIQNRIDEIYERINEFELIFAANNSADGIENEWNDLEDEKYDLEKQRLELSPTHKFIRLDDGVENNIASDISDEADITDGSGGMIETPAVMPKVKVLPQTPPAPEKVNYRYSEADNLFTGGVKTKFRNNIEAIRLVKHLETGGRLATPDEQKLLANYVGWGGLANAFSKTAAGWENEYQELKIILDDEEYKAAMNSTITAFYTEPKIAEYMHKALAAFGFEGGANRSILEPAMGTGNFFSVLPETLRGTKLHGVELDSISGKIARQLYQNANIQIQGFETTRFEDNSIDVITGNIPFNNIKVYDKRYEDENFLIHDYFIAKSLDLLKAGGIMAVITSKGTMDKADTSAREYFARRADLIGAVRLPNTAFKALSGTEVTADILFFQKLDQIRNVDKMELPEWVYTGNLPAPHYFRMNQYFIDHPDMILGEMTRDHRMYGNQDGIACVAPEGQELYAELNNAIGKLSAVFTAQPDPDVVALQIESEELPDGEKIRTDEDTKNFTYAVKDNDIYFCENGWLTKQDLTGAKAERVKGLCGIRSALMDVIAVQSRESGYQYNELEEAQKKLNQVYDVFVKKHGYINDKPNIAVFANDDQSPLLRSIEDLNNDNTTYSKAPIFTRATIKSYRQPTHAETAKEALEISLNMKLKVDLAYMAFLYEKPEDEIINELSDRIYLNPQSYYGNPHEGWETAEEYLSGDVVSKLDYAKLKAADNEMFTRNVTALQDVQPVKLLPSDIDFRIGSPWIPIEYYRQFMYETFETPEHLKPASYGNASRIELEYLEFTDTWRVSNKGWDSGSIKANQTYGTKRINGYEIYESSLNMQSVTIRDPVEYTDPNGERKTKYVVNANETMIARSKQQQLKETFASWLFNDKDRAEVLLTMYNDRFNRIRPREYEGSHLNFDGMSEERELRKHQKDVIARIVYHGTCLMAHEVGAGKTAAMIAAGMYMKNMGVIKKPIYVVPNHLIEQWSNEFMRFFPAANILATTKSDFEKKNRHKFISKIAMGDYDAIIIGHSQFEKVPISRERQERLLNEEISTLTRIIDQMKLEKGENWAIKQIVIFQNNLKSRLERLTKEERKDDLLNFEQLGVDYMFVDEAHVYKNCYTYTKMRNVAGIGQSKSQRASDMLMKCQFLQEVNKGRGVTMATGTPLSNSMSEMYVMQRFLQPDVLKKTGLHFFDKWAATFGDTISSLEMNPEGSGYRIKNRFSKFHNLPELMKLFRIVADIQTGDMLNLPLPEIDGGKAQVIVTERSAFQTQVMENFVERAEAIRKRTVDPETDNMLKLTNEAKLMAIDPRLVYADAPNDPNSKLNTGIRNVFGIWKDTAEERLTQVIFCDSGTPKPGQFNVYDEVKNELIKMGVPADEIAFVHDAKNDAQREAMFEKTRNGEIRILLGSTGKLGTGTNIQTKLYALHHFDVPWRPSDIIQRDGRGLRFGNDNGTIKIFRYVTKDTFDAYLWQIQEQKLRYISQIMTSKSVSRSAEDVDETVLTAAEIKAIATSNPLLAEKMNADNEVTRLKLLKGNWTNERITLERKISTNYPNTIKQSEERIKNITNDIAVLNKHRGGDFIMEVDGKRYSERALAGEMLLKVVKAKCDVGEGQYPVGSYRGLDLYAERKNFMEIDFRLVGGARYTVSAGDSVLGNITRIENLAERLPVFLSETETKLKETRHQLEVAKQSVGKPFEYEEKLSEYLTRQSEINTTLEFQELSKQQDEFLSEPDSGEKTAENEAEDEYEDEIEA